MKATTCLLTLFTVVAVGCSGKNSTPTTPSTPAPVTPTVTGLTITGGDAIRTGYYATYTATATMSNGTTQDVTSTATWTSSNNSVGGASQPGRLDGNAHGTVTLTASYQGRTATKSVSIVNNFGGTWSGTYVLTACDNSGGFATYTWCKSLGGVGTTLPFALNLDQTVSPDRTQLSGTFALGQLSGNVGGNVTGDGRLNIGGTYTVVNPSYTFTVTVGGWDTSLSGANGMAGRWALNLKMVGLTGNAYEECRIASATHSSLLDAGRNSAPSVFRLTIDETIQAILGR